MLLYFFSPKHRDPYHSELFYITSQQLKGGREQQLLPTLSDAATVDISVVVPAYNESSRLRLMLDDVMEHFKSSPVQSWEILIVDDGSFDGTHIVALEWAYEQVIAGHAQDEQLRVCRLAKNRGKGGCVSHGMQHVRGRYILFADADGASKFSDITKLSENLQNIEQNGLGVCVGSRAHLVTTEAVVQRSRVRNWLMYSFHAFLRFIGIQSIKDTQCGFKLFTRDAAALIFPFMHLDGWAFDVESLVLADLQGMPVAEVSIEWHEVAGSKISLLGDSVGMAIDLLVMRLNYTLGRWKVAANGKA